MRMKCPLEMLAEAGNGGPVKLEAAEEKEAPYEMPVLWGELDNKVIDSRLSKDGQRHSAKAGVSDLCTGASRPMSISRTFRS